MIYVKILICGMRRETSLFICLILQKHDTSHHNLHITEVCISYASESLIESRHNCWPLGMQFYLPAFSKGESQHRVTVHIFAGILLTKLTHHTKDENQRQQKDAVFFPFVPYLINSLHGPILCQPDRHDMKSTEN